MGKLQGSLSCRPYASYGSKVLILSNNPTLSLSLYILIPAPGWQLGGVHADHREEKVTTTMAATWEKSNLSTMGKMWFCSPFSMINLALLQQPQQSHSLI